MINIKIYDVNYSLLVDANDVFDESPIIETEFEPYSAILNAQGCNLRLVYNKRFANASSENYYERFFSQVQETLNSWHRFDITHNNKQYRFYLDSQEAVRIDHENSVLEISLIGELYKLFDVDIEIDEDTNITNLVDVVFSKINELTNVNLFRSYLGGWEDFMDSLGGLESSSIKFKFTGKITDLLKIVCVLTKSNLVYVLQNGGFLLKRYDFYQPVTPDGFLENLQELRSYVGDIREDVDFGESELSAETVLDNANKAVRIKIKNRYAHSQTVGEQGHFIFAKNDIVVDINNREWQCTKAGDTSGNDNQIAEFRRFDYSVPPIVDGYIHFELVLVADEDFTGAGLDFEFLDYVGKEREYTLDEMLELIEPTYRYNKCVLEGRNSNLAVGDSFVFEGKSLVVTKIRRDLSYNDDGIPPIYLEAIEVI